jgi:guanylate kinase
MKIIGCQYNKISGPDATSSYKVEFMVDESQRDGVLDLAKKLKKGAELLLMIFETGEEENEVKELVNEKPEETKKRLYRRIHAMINDIASEKKLDAKVIKDSLKQYLIQKKLMINSTKELDLKGLSTALYYLQTEYGMENNH